MQQFFFLCTMLITASEAFPEEFLRSGIPKKIRKKTVELEPKRIYPNTGRFMSGDVSLPTFFVPYLYRAPFLLPIGTKYGKGKALRRTDNSKKFKKRFLRRRKWPATHPRDMTGSFTFSSPEYSEYSENPNIPSDAHRDSSNSNSFSAAISGNRNQYTIRSYPRIKEGKFKRYKKRRLSPSERRYWNSIRFKNKRNANVLSNQENGYEEYKKKDEGDELNEAKTGHELSNARKKKPQSGDKKETGEGKNSKKNLATQKGSENGAKEHESKHVGENPPSKENETCPNSTIPKDRCEPRTHKSSLISDGSSYVESLKKDSTGVDDFLREGAQDYSTRIVKLKEMLDQVQFLLKDDLGKGKEKSKIGSKEKGLKFLDKSDESGGKGKAKTFSLKDKIDTAIPILMQISEDLIRISNMSDTRSNSHDDKTPPRCSPDGTWTSTEYDGLEMTFKTLPNMMLKVSTVSRNDGLINKKWSMQGLTLSKEGGPIILAAICPQKRKIASFMGQCKICKDQDIIFGSWTVYTFVHKFTDLWKAVDFRLDILKKKMGSGV